MNNSIIEINKKKAKAGRVPIKLVLHKLAKDEEDSNRNGIVWLREFCEQNLDSINGMQLVTQFLDDKHEIPFGDHGNMTIVEENKVVFEDSLVVGSFTRGYVVENLEINGEIIDAVVGEGYIFNQRFPSLCTYLEEQYQEGNPVEGSVEICADESKGNTKIIYRDGWKPKNRIPKDFQYSGHALVIGTSSADCSAVMLELNSYKRKDGEDKKVNKNVVSKGISIELNKLSYSDIAVMVTRAFNKAMNPDKIDDYYYYGDYEIHRFYPETSEVVFSKWRDAGSYYMCSYKIENSTVSIGEIVKVEEDWKPVSDSQPVEINTEQIKNIIKGGDDLKTIEELTAKVTELSTQLGEVNNKVTELNSANEEKETKIAELNELLVDANKKLEEATTKCSTLEVECNGYKEEKEKVEAEQRKAEVNSYFETEIPKNNFEEAEVNSLKEYVEKCDLEGLKKAEADLIVKRFKEGKLNIAEVNSQKNDNLFFNTKQEKIDDVEAGKLLFN